MPDLWVFAYGSLMWRPGFAHAEAVPALLHGAHRSLCIYSVVHRGTRRRPGLVLGLDLGGTCRGIAFRVAPGRERATMAYLRRREQANYAYRQVMKRVELADGSGRSVRALCYLVDRRHRQYAGRMPLSAQAWLVRRSRGRSGDNVEYLLNTARHLHAMGIEDRPLGRLLGLFGGRRPLTRAPARNGQGRRKGR